MKVLLRSARAPVALCIVLCLLGPAAASRAASRALRGSGSPATAATHPTAAAPLTARPGAGAAMVTDPTLVFTVPSTPRPGYLATTPEPTFGTDITRIGNNPGLSLGGVPGTWGSDARHVYSKQQPRNSDNTLLTIENRSGGSPSPLILDGTTYAPKLAPCANYSLYDYRWHPSPAHPHEQINVDPTGNELMWFDVTTCTKTRTWTLPITVNYGIGSAEGNPSNDGRYVALSNDNGMFVVDMDPQPPFAPYPNKRIGPVYTFAACSLGTACTLDYVTASASGRYVDVKYD